MAKLYDYVDKYGNAWRLMFAKTVYAYGGSIAVEAYSENSGEGDVETSFDPYAPITVNLPIIPLTDERCAWIDTNNSRHIAEWMVRGGFMSWTGRSAHGTADKNLDRLGVRLGGPHVR